MSDINVANLLGAGGQASQAPQMGVPHGMGNTPSKFGSVLNKVLVDKESTELAGNVAASMLLMNMLGGAAPTTNPPEGTSADTATVSVQKAAPPIDMTALGKTAVLNPNGDKEIKKSADVPKQDDKNTDDKSNKDTGSAEKTVSDANTAELLKESATKNDGAAEEKAQASDAMNAAIENLFKDNTKTNTPKEKSDANAPKEMLDANAPKDKLDTNPQVGKFDVGDTQIKEVVQSQTDNNTGEKKQDKPADTKTGKEQVVEFNDTQGSQQALGAEKAPTAVPRDVNNENAVPKTTVQINEHTFSVSKLSDSSIEVRLEPEGLGSVKIHLNMENGTLHADIRASTEAAKTIIEKNLNDIVKTLTQEGLTVGDFSVSLKDKGNQGEYKKQPGAADKKISRVDLPEDEEVTPVKRYSYSDNGKVNIFA